MVRVSILLLLILIQGSLFFEMHRSDDFIVAFLDVGQGDAIYVRAPNGNDLLIDGGSSESVLRELAKVMDPTDRTIDVVIATHPDKDHIGGLIPVLERYTVTHFLDSGVSNDTLVYRELVKRVAERTNYVVARRGMDIYLDKDTVVHILYPDKEILGDTNAASIALRISYKHEDVLLTGDAPKHVERLLLPDVIESEILKVGHHGSKTSSDISFLKKVAPEYAIISAGNNNSYGHPHATIISALRALPTTILSTIEEGSIVFVSKGEGFVKR